MAALTIWCFRHGVRVVAFPQYTVKQVLLLGHESYISHENMTYAADGTAACNLKLTLEKKSGETIALTRVLTYSMMYRLKTRGCKFL